MDSRELDDEITQLSRPGQRQEVPTALERNHLDAGYEIGLVFTFGRPCPISVPPNKQYRNIDAAVVFGSIFPASPVSAEAEESVVVSSRLPTRYISSRSAEGMLFGSATPPSRTFFMMKKLQSRIAVSPRNGVVATPVMALVMLP
jgi:hypothetical protein